MTDINLSTLAKPVISARDPRRAPNDRGKPFGFLVHTTGGGVTDMARKRREAPLNVALRIYTNAQNGKDNGDTGYNWGGPHYVMPHDGSIHQMAPDNLRTEHAGGGNRLRYFDGSWEKAFPVTAKAWHKQWSAVKTSGGRTFTHPYQLFPSRSPNHDYIGLEMIPCGDGFGTPLRPGLRFSKEQHEGVARIARDCAERHGWPPGWQNGSRFVGHEDVDPIERSWPTGGWDPGFLRDGDPFFDFTLVRASV